VTVHRAYLGIGSNDGDREANVERALAALVRAGTIGAQSSRYRTAPWGVADQPWFLNAVVALHTELDPHALLAALQEVECTLGRVRARKWGPRTIDLDLLLYDDADIDEPSLRVPHPRLRERAFVLVPLAEIDDRFVPLRDALTAAELAGVELAERENRTDMPDEAASSVAERVRALALFLEESGATRVRIARDGEHVEVSTRGTRAAGLAETAEGAPAAATAARVDAIKADLVGIFHLSRPTPAEGDVLDADRELGFVEALGIRTPVHSMGGGRLVGIPVADGAAVEYGQALFLVARGN
jgi:2-amino-4-hydroxy-6-hydroxymethyldihydropteridine diphosphokinase